MHAMRLLNTTTIKLEELVEGANRVRIRSRLKESHNRSQSWTRNADGQENDKDSYAILSHTWEEEEVTLQDFKQDVDEKKLLSLILPHGDARLAQDPQYLQMKGYSKLQGCCLQANHDGYDYVWIDTCCIDKSSSAELSEAINSMFRWYQEADICYAYLSDVNRPKDGQIDWSAFHTSRWFTRGWTLQELLAPKEVIFYANDWTEIGTRSTLYERISDITGIDVRTLRLRPDYRSIYDFSIAQRMSWAAMRETTRTEDIAYCLMGIFDVNLPLMYGEGAKAFTRLQEEIIRTSGDDSIFAYHCQRGVKTLLAPSPRVFKKGGSIEGHIQIHRNRMAAPYWFTHRGLCIELYLAPYPLEGKQYWMAGLHCIDIKRPGPIRIFLEKWEGEDDMYNKISLNQSLTTFDQNASGWRELKENERKRVYIMLNGNQRPWADFDTVVKREHP